MTVQPPEREQVATLALVLVIDRSGSMSGSDTADRRANRWTWPKKGPSWPWRRSRTGDQAGVVAFDTSAQLDRRGAAP